ncbi:pectate lyase superfamily protein-domain-containing protein [Mycena rebaudengoi]|nr:pectate lyase superfamily protein-domain-containing protein [Mycena rebaudengoi]
MRNLSFSLAALAIFFRSASSTCSEPLTGTASSSDPFWMRNGGLQIQGKSAYNPGFKVFRDVKLHYGGSSLADDTAAINKAITGPWVSLFDCRGLSLITPAIVYFPSGKYRVTKPIVPFYFTSLVGDANNKPILIADPNFVGTAVIDANPYKEGESNPDGSGVNWWINQNNFFRSIRNFVIDVTAMSPEKSATGIHWQVGQATSLINIDFKMVRATVTPTTNHQGLFAENGSGGFMSDLTFDGAKILRRVRSAISPQWQRGYGDNIEEGWRRNGVDWWYSPLGSNDQPSIANRHHDNIFKSIPFRTQYEALFGEYLKSNFTEAIMESYVHLNEGTSDAARRGEVHNGAAEYVGDMVKNNFMEAIWRVTCNLNELTSDAARRGEVHSGAAEYVGDMVKNNFMKAIWRVTCNLNERTSDAARRGEVHTGAALVAQPLAGDATKTRQTPIITVGKTVESPTQNAMSKRFVKILEV